MVVSPVRALFEYLAYRSHRILFKQYPLQTIHSTLTAEEEAMLITVNV